MQSQTTFAVLGKGEDGDFEVRVLKQKIWVEGVSYELQVRTAFPHCWQVAGGVHGSSAGFGAEVLQVVACYEAWCIYVSSPSVEAGLPRTMQVDKQNIPQEALIAAV